MAICTKQPAKNGAIDIALRIREFDKSRFCILALAIIIMLFAYAGHASQICSVANVNFYKFSYDPEGIKPYNAGITDVPLSTNTMPSYVWAIAKGSCPDDDYVYLDVYDASDIVFGHEIHSIPVHFFNGIANEFIQFTQPPYIAGHTYIFTITDTNWNNRLTTDTRLRVSSSATCGNGMQNSNPFEPCDASAAGAFGASSFYDNKNTVTEFGFDSGIRECQDIFACTMSFAHACDLKLAAITPNCGGNACEAGETIDVSLTGMRRTPLNHGNHNVANCRVEPGDLIKVDDANSNCEFAITADVEPQYDQYFDYDVYKPFTKTYRITSIPADCANKVVTNPVVRMYSDAGTGVMAEIANAQATATFQFGQNYACTAEAYFAKDAQGGQRFAPGGTITGAGQAYVCVNNLTACQSQNLLFDVEIYDTDNGVNRDGFVEVFGNDWQLTGTGAACSPFPRSGWPPPQQLTMDGAGSADAAGFSNQDPTTEYMIRAFNTANGATQLVDVNSTNWIEAPVTCDDGTALNTCKGTTGLACVMFNGAPALRPNCAGQAGLPSCGCAAGNSCGAGQFDYYLEDVESMLIDNTKKKDEGGSASQLIFTNNPVHAGSTSLKFTKQLAAGYSVYIFNQSGLVPGTSYTASVYVFTNKPNFARIYGKQSGHIEPPQSVSAFHSGSNSWEQLTFTFTPTSSTYNVMIEVTGAQGEAFFDDISVSESAQVCIPAGQQGCNIDAVSIAAACPGPGDRCGPGEEVRITGSYSGASCPSQVVMQVDASDDLFSPTCYIERDDTHNLGPNGFISGMNIACSNGVCNALWPLPGSIPQNCLGKTMSGRSAGLYTQGGAYLDGLDWDQAIGGSFAFSGRPSLAGIATNVSVAHYGTPVRATGSGASAESPFRLECGTVQNSNNLCQGEYGTTPSPTCDFPFPWSDSAMHTIYCRVYDGAATSTPDKTAQMQGDMSGPVIRIVAPPQGSWQIPPSFDVTVDWADSAPGTCKYKITSGGVETVPLTSMACTDTVINDVTVSPAGNCRNAGSNKCKIEIYSTDNVGNPSYASATYSISLSEPVLDVTLVPDEIGAPIYYTVTGSGSSDAGIKNMTVNITARNRDSSQQFQSYPPNTQNAVLTLSKTHPAGAVVDYWARLYDNSGRMQYQAGNFKICSLNAVSINSCTGSCFTGQNVTISVSYDGKCPSTSYINIYSEAEDGMCDIIPSNGDLSGMQFTCASGTCTGRWTIPAGVPAECFGKRIVPYKAELRQGAFTGTVFHEILPPNVTGSFTFGYPPGSCGAVLNNSCAQLGQRPDYCENGVIKKRADLCGCNNGFWKMQDIGSGQYDCVPAVCENNALVTDYLVCERSNNYNTGLYCDGVPKGGGTNVILNMTLYPNAVGQHALPACSCPPGQDAASQPYWYLFNQSFESQQDIVFENLNGSAANGGIFNGGYNGIYAYYITKTNSAGESRALLPFNAEPGQTYTVTARVSTDKTNFARIYDKETGIGSQYHSGDSGWLRMQYTFTASRSVHTIALSAANRPGTVAFDLIEVRKHDLLCTAVCIDGTPNSWCSDSDADDWGPPYYCDANNNAYPNLIRRSSLCGCPAGEEPDGNEGCVPFSCEPDGTPYGECSVNGLTGQYDDLGGDHGILFCNNGIWQERPDICGCEENWGFDNDTGACVDCTGQIDPPVGGYALCNETGGTLNSDIIIENLTCTASYDCVCPPGKVFDPGFGCVSTCRENGVCEPFESSATCPADCPIEWSGVVTNVTDIGAHFEGELGVTFMLGFRSCRGNADPLLCKSVPAEECSANSSCLCGSAFDKECDVVCHDRRDVFYLLGEGTYIPPGNPFDARNVIISSDVANFTCPVFHMDQLNTHLENFRMIQRSAFIGLEQAIINFERSETDEEKQYWQQQINIFNEVLIVTDAHITYLEDVVAGVNEGRYGLAKVNEAFSLTEQKYQEILDILAGNVTVFTMELDFPEVLEVPQGQGVDVNISAIVSSSGNATRFAFTACQLADPNSTKYYIKSNCSVIDPGTQKEFVMNQTMSKFGTWAINYCSLNVSTISNCAGSMEFFRISDAGTINITQLALLRIIKIEPPSSELGVGDQAVVKVDVQNADVVDHAGFVQCKLMDPTNRPYTIASDNKTVPLLGTTQFSPNMTVAQEGTWTVLSCTVYRLGSVINEGTVVINENFDVGPPDFLLSPASGSGSVSPGSAIVYNVTIKNKGLGPETYTTALETTNNWSASLTTNRSGNSLRLNKGESAMLFLSIVHRSNMTPETTSTLTVTSQGAGRTKSSVFTTTVSFPNRPPEVSVIEVPENIIQNTTVTFSADIIDAENSSITAKACVIDCNHGCTLVRTGSIYACNYRVSLPFGSYVYFINASDGSAVQLSDNYNFRVVQQGYCGDASDCAEGQQCKNNVCRDVVTCPGTSQQCYISSDGSACESCGSGFNCVSGVCRQQAECNRDEDCSGNRLCRNYKCTVSLAGTCGDGVCSTGEKCPADCGGEESPLLLIIAVVVVVAVFIGLVLYIRKRREEEEDFEQ